MGREEDVGGGHGGGIRAAADPRDLGLFTNWQESSSVLIAQTAWVQISALPLPSWVILGKSHSCSMPQFPLLYNGDNSTPEYSIPQEYNSNYRIPQRIED